MTFFIKKKIIQAGISKKQKNNPFDYLLAENYSLPKDADKTINNSYYFSAHSLSKNQSLYLRLGERIHTEEVWFFYSDSSNTYVYKNLYNDKESCPLNIKKSQDGWKIEFSGECHTLEGEKSQVSFIGEFSSSLSAVDFFSHMPAERTAIAMAQEKWNKAFFSEVQKNNQVHYEQFGNLKGTLTIDKKETPLSLPTVRDHSFGKRNWNYMNNHLWLTAVDKNFGLNYSMVSYPSFSMLEVGNVYQKEKGTLFILKCDLDLNLINTGNIPERLQFNLTLSDKRKIGVSVEKLQHTDYYFQDGEYLLIEGIANFDVDGLKVRGILEIGFNKDKNRWFNGKDLRKIKR